MATFNHSRGDSPRTPCAKCALESGWTRVPGSDALQCPDCRSHVSMDWLDEASAVGNEHVCVRPSGLCREVSATILANATDAELHAEYARRFGGQPPIEKYRAALADRDEWKRIADNAGKTIAALEGRLRDATQRAEAAEQRAGVHESLKRSAQRSREETHAEFMRVVELLTPEQARELLMKHYGDGPVASNESGPGIAATPSVAPLKRAALDEATLTDLLCGDA